MVCNGPARTVVTSHFTTQHMCMHLLQCDHTGVCLFGSFESNFLCSLSGSLEAILEKSLKTSENVLSPERQRKLLFTIYKTTLYYFLSFIAAITSISGFHTYTRLMGHIPLHWFISLVWQQLWRKHALQAGFSVWLITLPVDVAPRTTTLLFHRSRFQPDIRENHKTESNLTQLRTRPIQ